MNEIDIIPDEYRTEEQRLQEEMRQRDMMRQRETGDEEIMETESERSCRMSETVSETASETESDQEQESETESMDGDESDNGDNLTL